METAPFYRRPFVAEAIQITEENIEELNEKLDLGVVKVNAKGQKYIAFNARVVPLIRKGFVGWWITIFDDNYRCFAPRLFQEQFVPAETDPNLKAYFEALPETDPNESPSDTNYILASG